MLLIELFLPNLINSDYDACCRVCENIAVFSRTDLTELTTSQLRPRLALQTFAHPRPIMVIKLSLRCPSFC